MLRFITLFLTLASVQCAKILVVSPIPAYSHFSLGFRLATELADRGHQVTVINPYPQKTPIKNYEDVSVEENVAFMEELKKNLFEVNKFNPYQNMQMLITMGTSLADLTLSNKNVQKLLNSGREFDLVIVAHFLNDAHLGFAHHFKAPCILLSPAASSSLNNYIFANPAPSSYVPNILTQFTKHMTFWQRIQNVFLNSLSDILRQLIYMPKQNELFKKHFKTDVEFEDVLYNVSLMMTNSHVSVNDAVPRVPNIIEIGGFHVKPPKKLPQDLQKFLDEAAEGVVLFSMGSNLKSKDLKLEVRKDILKALSKIKQKVLWKFEEDLPDLPKNIKIMKWVPQQDVLAHPNIKAFISHGGLLSTIETVNRGVPIIGIPVFGDQKNNIASAVQNGYAVGIPLPELSEEKLSWALNEVLNNPKYRDNVKWRSRVMNDQPLKPIDTAVFWVEHVIRHKGAPHLRSAGVDLKWCERHMVDVIVVLGLSTIVLFVVFYVVLKRILRLCFGKKKPQVTKGKKTK